MNEGGGGGGVVVVIFEERGEGGTRLYDAAMATSIPQRNRTQGHT